MEDYSDWVMVDGTTNLDADYFNPILQRIDERINQLESGAVAFNVLIPSQASHPKNIIVAPFACDSIKVCLGAAVYPSGANVIVNVYKGMEADGGAAGSKLFSDPARPTLKTLSNGGTGASAYFEADQNLPIAAGDKLGIQVDQTDTGPTLTNLLVTVLLIPSAP